MRLIPADLQASLLEVTKLEAPSLSEPIYYVTEPLRPLCLFEDLVESWCSMSTSLQKKRNIHWNHHGLSAFGLCLVD